MTQKTVLLLEDDIVQVQLVIDLFQRKFPNTHLITVNTVEEGIVALNNNIVDLTLVDLMLEDGKSGLEIFPKTQAQHPRSSVVVITADNSNDTEKFVMSHGVDGFITKPISIDHLSSIIRSILITY